MFPYLPHSEDDIRIMLDTVGVSSINQLFSDIPEKVRLPRALNIPPSKAEEDVLRSLRNLAKNNCEKILFMGGGMYDHVIPSLVPHLAGRSEFVTAYTPYQPEISQGMLQALFDFQSSMAEITGLPVANASLYDGYTAAAEACVMALNAKRKGNVILLASTIHPFTQSILKSYFADLDVRLVQLRENAGRIELNTLIGEIEEYGEALAAVLVQTPNIYGALEDLSGWSEAVHAVSARLIISSHPLSLGSLSSPAQWGADIAVGDTQPLGLPPFFGGPSAGYICCQKDLIRRMPGRIVGETVDNKGKRAFVLTLQAREQHIKRERATSNICTNQSLAAVSNLVYLAALGPAGFRDVSARNIHAAAYLRDRLNSELGLKNYFNGPIFNEFTLEIPVSREKWLSAFRSSGMAPGFYQSDLNRDNPSNLFTIAVTEKRTTAEMDAYLACAGEALK